MHSGADATNLTQFKQQNSNPNFNTTENNKRENPSIYDLQNRNFIIDEKKDPIVLRKQDVNLKKSLNQ